MVYGEVRHGLINNIIVISTTINDKVFKKKHEPRNKHAMVKTVVSELLKELLPGTAVLKPWASFRMKALLTYEIQI